MQSYDNSICWTPPPQDVVSRASLALVDCLGLLDPSSSVQYLALHQSCQVAAELSSLLRRVHSPPQASRLAALIQHCSSLQGDCPLPTYTKDCPALGEHQVCGPGPQRGGGGRWEKLGETEGYCPRQLGNMYSVRTSYGWDMDALYCTQDVPTPPPAAVCSDLATTSGPLVSGERVSCKLPIHYPPALSRQVLLQA